jgi:hypothetical protein
MSTKHGHGAFNFVFSAALVGLLLVGAGLIGYQPPANINLAEAGWRRGVWTGHVIWGQVALGSAFLLAAAYGARRINRHL